MERLTSVWGKNYELTCCLRCFYGFGDKCTTCKKRNDAIAFLAAYEDTGLTPKGVIAACNRQPAPENVRHLLETIHTLRNEKAALKARYDEINRYNISCTKKIDELLAEKVAAPENKSRFENCHIYEAGENVESIADICEVLIKGEDLQKLITAPENKPLPLEQLKRRNSPVWVPLQDGTGYWCLCRNGLIIPPSGFPFMAEDRPNWTFLDHEPEDTQ